MKCILHRHFLAEVSAAQWVGILPYHTKLGLLDSQREPLPVFSECSTCVEAVFNQVFKQGDRRKEIIEVQVVVSTY